MLHSVTIKKNHEFRRLYTKGRRAVLPSLVLYALSNRGDRNRVGFTVTVKLGSAVVRNRIRRRLREIYRLHEQDFRRGLDLVVVARARCVTASYAELEQAFLKAAEKLDLLNKEGRL